MKSILDVAEVCIKNVATPVRIIAQMLFAHMLGIVITLFQFSSSSHQLIVLRRCPHFKFFKLWNTLQSKSIK